MGERTKNKSSPRWGERDLGRTGFCHAASAFICRQDEPKIGEFGFVTGKNGSRFAKNNPSHGKNKALFPKTDLVFRKNKPSSDKNSLCFTKNKPVFGENDVSFDKNKAVFAKMRSVLRHPESQFPAK